MWEAIKHFLMSKPVDVPDKAPETWELRNEEERERLARRHCWSQHAHDANIWHLQGSGDGSALISAAYQGLVRVWDAQTGNCRAELQLPETPRALAIAPDASQVVFSLLPDAPLTVWDVRENLCTQLPLPCRGLATQIVYRSPTQLLALVRHTESFGEDPVYRQYDYIKIVNIDVQQKRSEVSFETTSSQSDPSALMTPDGRLLAWTVDDPGRADAIQLAALPDSRLQERFSVPNTAASARINLRQFSPDGKRLLIYAQDDSGFDHRNEVGDNFSQYVFWDVDSRQNLRALDYASLRNVITYACTPDPNVYVCVTEKLVFTRFDDNRDVLEIQAPGDTARIALLPVFAPDKSWRAYATSSGNIHVFDLP